MATPGSRIPCSASGSKIKPPNAKLTISPVKLKTPVAKVGSSSTGFKKPKLPFSSTGPRKPADRLNTGGKKRQNENSPTRLTREKRMKIDSTPSNYRLQKTNSSFLVNSGFSESAKRRAVLQPQKSSNIVRESAPVLTEGKKLNKRPAWDIKGRLLDMETVNKGLTEKLESFMNRVTRLEVDKSTLEHDVESKTVFSQEAMTSIEKLTKDLNAKSTELENIVRERDIKVAEFQAENSALKSENSLLKTKVASSEQIITNLTTTEMLLKTELDSIKLQYSQTLSEKETCEATIVKLKEKNEQLEEKLREHETSRRELHNTIQELKGNIRVFCRVRPLLRKEANDALLMSSISVSDDSKALEISHTSNFESTNSLHKSKTALKFSFDLVFNQNATQEKVFEEISGLVQSALDGYNVCIFAYGQTGSGKTYTMEGPEDLVDFVLSSNDDRLGIIPRTVNQIFDAAQELQIKGWKYKIETSFMEIYNENIRDMLVDNSHNAAPKCEIKRTASKGNDGFISNITTVLVTSAEQVLDLLKKARANRAVAATNCNERSSRSHYIFQMKLLGENEVSGEKCEGILNLIDLAGSERVKESGSAGERFIEAKNINKSLSNLGNVIMALSQKADHVPYRNSKLTHILMNSLGGQAKTLMFVNISPCEDHFNETVNSLRFATKVNQCTIGTAQKRIKN